MKTKKFNLNWQSVLLGMVLCLVLVVFVGSRAQTAQTEAGPSILKKVVTMNVLLDKCELIDQRILVVEGKINHLQERVDYILEITENMWRQMKK